ncbi:MAG: tyrosine-type recombinase/integrase [Christensenellales bacterium]|jgi:integrase
MSKRGENNNRRKDGRNGRFKYDRRNNEMKIFLTSFLGFKKSFFYEILENWLKNCQGCVKASTYENYYYSMQKYILPYFRKYKVEMITESHVKEFILFICNNISISQSYRKKILQIFKTALKEILDDNENAANIINALRFPRVIQTVKPVEIFSVYEQRRIENMLLMNKGNKDIGLLICFYTGIRLGELCALSWNNIDFESKTLTICKTLIRTKNFEAEGPKTKLSLCPPKSKSSVRKIPLPDFLYNILHDRLLQVKSLDDYMLSNSSIPVDPRTIQRYYERLLSSAGVSHRKFHAIRHTFATRALEIGIDIKTVSEILGHSGITATLNTYAHSLLEQKRLAISKMNIFHTSKMSNLSEPSPVQAVNPCRQ